MKKYIKPNTEINEIELQTMIATSPGLSKETTNPEEIEAKDNTLPTTTSLWDEEE